MIEISNVTHLFNADWDELSRQLRGIEQLKRVRPENSRSTWGGWSIQSSSGSYQDGWSRGHTAFTSDQNGNVVVDPAAVVPAAKYVIFTDIASPEFRDCVNQVKQLGLEPARARIAQLDPSQETGWHIDAPPDRIAYRLHFVIETNPEAVFDTEQEACHLKARNVFILNVNYPHRIRNHGATARTHLIMDLLNIGEVSRLLSKAVS